MDENLETPKRGQTNAFKQKTALQDRANLEREGMNYDN
jgi:hypothetical protein